MKEVVETVLEGLRPAFQANGADLELKEIVQDSVKIDVVFGPDACRDCVLPPEMLGPTFAQLLGAQLGRPIAVVVGEVG
jgi:hypothetical protein